MTVAALLSGFLLFPDHWHAFRAHQDAWIHHGTALVLVNTVMLVLLALPVPPPDGSVASDLVQIFGLPWMIPARLEAFFKVASASFIPSG